MKVVHLSSAHPISDPRIHLREAATLAQHGYDVTLVANDHGIDIPMTGVHVIAIQPRGRLCRMVVNSVKVLLTGLQARAKVFHLHDPELIWAIVPLRLLGKIVIYDAHEDLPAQMRAKPYLNTVTVRPAILFARLLIRFASLSNWIFAATDHIAETFPAHKVTVVKNYPLLRPADDDGTALTQRPLNVGYLGLMAPSRGTTAMIDALSSDDFPPSWRAVVAGPIPALYHRELANRPGWAKVDYRGSLSTDDARDLLQRCRVGIVTLTRTQAYLDSLPTKMFEYFAAGIPAIASDFPLWRSIIERFDCGIVVDERSPDEIARAVSRYASDPDLLVRHGQNALRAARNELNWGLQAEALLAGYQRALGTRRSLRRRSADPAGQSL